MAGLTVRMSVKRTTENKIRYDAVLSDSVFELYIPRARLPQVAPDSIEVTVSTGEDSGEAPGVLSVVVDRISDHTKTVRYQPRGAPDDWALGEPYIPYELLDEISPDVVPDCVRVDVQLP